MKRGKSEKKPINHDGTVPRDYTCEQLSELLVNSIPRNLLISYSQGPLTVHPQLVHRVITKNKCVFCPLNQFKKINQNTLYFTRIAQIPYNCEDGKISY